MQIKNVSPASRRNNLTEDFRIHWSAEKSSFLNIYQRSFVPTVTHLLSGVTEHHQLSDNRATYIHSMQAQTERKGIPKTFTNTDETLHDPNSEYKTQARFRSFGSSPGTEDIFVRQDEDGLLTHYCPLDRERDGEKGEENFLGHPIMTDHHASWIPDSNTLKSEEIPFLMAERPSDFENEESEVSDIDASTSMIYAPTENQRSSIDEGSSLNHMLQKGKRAPSFSFRLLEEKTMEAWVEDYSDDNSDCDVYNETDFGEISKYVTGEESDMEEFNETSQINKDEKKSESTRNNENIENNQEGGTFLKSRIDEEADANSSSEHPEKRNSDKCIDDCEQRTLCIKPRNSSGKENNKDSECNLDGEYSSQSSESQRQMESVEAKLENATLNATVKLNSLAEIQKNPWNISSDITEEIAVDDFSGRLFSVQESGKIKEGILEGENTHSDKGKCEVKSNVPAIDYSSKTGNEVVDFAMGFCPKPEADIKANVLKQPNEQKQNFISMEPIVMNLETVSNAEESHPDLATALRFLTEVHHIKEDELPSDILGTTDMSDEVALTEMPKTSAIPDDYQRENLQGNFISVKSQCQSRTSEAVALNEESRTEVRPQNKLRKFFKSFKKKLLKKA